MNLLLWKGLALLSFASGHGAVVATSSDFPDLTGYSVHFEQCQEIQAYDDEMASVSPSSATATKRFVLFRLCPNHNQNVEDCSEKYGEYLIDLEEYTEILMEHYRAAEEEFCNICQHKCIEHTGEISMGSSAVDCYTCQEECAKLENMEENGYIDASEFLYCQMIYDPEDDAAQPLYAGPMCAPQGSKIKIGVFPDEECNVLDPSKYVEDFLMDEDGYQMKLSYYMLKQTYASEIMLSCADELDDASINSNPDGESESNTVNREVCEKLYDRAAKCETPYGLQLASQDTHFHNQNKDEAQVCRFIQELKTGTYRENKGSVVVGSSSGEFAFATTEASTTAGQRFVLTFTGFVVLAMLVWVIKLKVSLFFVRKRHSATGASYHLVQLSEVAPVVNSDQKA